MLSRAQQPVHERSGVALTAGLASLPDGLSTQCGNRGGPNGGGGGLEVGAAFMFRITRLFVVQADTRATDDLLSGLGCDQVGAVVYTTYAENLHHDVVGTSTLRAGLETPPGWLLLRLTAGLGIVWGAQFVPVGVLAIGTGTRGPGARFVVEFERSQTRIHGTEVRQNPYPAPETRTPVVVRPAWYALRFGVEFPMNDQRAEQR